MRKRKQWVNDQKKKEKELLNKLKEEELEDNDTLAMIIAAMITLVPAVIIIMAVFAFTIWFFFAR